MRTGTPAPSCGRLRRVVSPTRLRDHGSLVLAFVLLVAPYLAFAAPAWTVGEDPVLSKRIDAINQGFTAPGMPGAIVAILEHGRVIHLKGYGYANREFRIPWDPTIRYTFFSTTKPMVATAFLRLQDQGRLSLDDDIRRYLPELPVVDPPVRIRHLLTHTSGIWEDEVLMHLLGTSVSYSPVGLDELFALARKQTTMANTPGSYYYYNDAGMRVAARVLEKVTGKSFRAAMRDELFEPSGMKDADTKPWEPMYFPREASTYLMDHALDDDVAGTAIRIGTVVPETSGDGAGVGTILDLVQFARFITRTSDARPSYLQRLVAPVYYRDGLYGAYRTSFNVTSHRGHAVYCHFGFYGKGILYLPDKDRWIVFMRNAMDSREQIPRDYVVALLDAALGYAGSATGASGADGTFMSPPAEEFSAADLSALVGTFLEPQSGYVLRIRARTGGVAFRMLGSGGALVHDPSRPASFRTYIGQASPIVQLQIDRSTPTPGLLLLHSDWEAPRPLTRLRDASLGTSASAAREYAGLYRSGQFGVVYEVRDVGSGQLQLQIGAGVRSSDRVRLERVADDVFETRQAEQAAIFTMDGVVRFDRSGGRIKSLTYSTNDVRGLTLERLPVSSAGE